MYLAPKRRHTREAARSSIRGSTSGGDSGRRSRAIGPTQLASASQFANDQCEEATRLAARQGRTDRSREAIRGAAEAGGDARRAAQLPLACGAKPRSDRERFAVCDLLGGRLPIGPRAPNDLRSRYCLPRTGARSGSGADLRGRARGRARRWSRTRRTDRTAGALRAESESRDRRSGVADCCS
jgi:hypothetical protein